MNALHALFPRGRAEVLRVLFLQPDRESHLRSLARGTGLSLRVVQREVELLESLGFVETRRDGNRRYLRASTRHPAAPEVRRLVEKCAGAQPLLAEALRTPPGILVAFLFGSFAADTARAASDLDLMVLGTVSLRALVPALRPTAERLGREINPVVLPSEDWAARLRAGDAFICRVAAEPKIFLRGTADELAAMGRERVAATAPHEP